jgi:sulfatase modifying factor 1
MNVQRSDIRRWALAITCGSLVMAHSPAHAGTVSIDWVTVRDAGNLPQSGANRSHSFSGGDGFGAVADDYRIGRYLVTNDQYAAFLNAVAKSDPHGLYNSNMSTSTHGGITRTGESGNFSYSVKSGMGDRPVNFVSWFDAARMANWMHNGQGSGSTETGVYSLNGTTADWFFPTKQANATVWIPSENEWFKAAYYDGPTGQYSLFATGRNDIITSQANYGAQSLQGSWNTVTAVGQFRDFPSNYGTYDQSGNVYEWTDGIYEIPTNPEFIPERRRKSRGGSWFNGTENLLRSSEFSIPAPTTENDFTGFRLAAVPEPATLVLALGGALCTCGWWVLKRRPRART